MWFILRLAAARASGHERSYTFIHSISFIIQCQRQNARTNTIKCEKSCRSICRFHHGAFPYPPSVFVFTPSAFLPFSPLDHSHNGQMYEISQSLLLFVFLALFLLPLTKTNFYLHPDPLRSFGNFCLPHDPTADNDFRGVSSQFRVRWKCKRRKHFHIFIVDFQRETSHLNKCFCFPFCYLWSLISSWVLCLCLTAIRVFRFMSASPLSHLLTMVQSLRESFKNRSFSRLLIVLVYFSVNFPTINCIYFRCLLQLLSLFALIRRKFLLRLCSTSWEFPLSPIASWSTSQKSYPRLLFLALPESLLMHE